MTPYYHDDRAGITIYHGDCREVLPGLPKVDLVLTDPPYGVKYVTSWRSRTDPLRSEIANDSDLGLVAEAWPLTLDRLSDDRHWYAFASPRMLQKALGIFTRFKAILAWEIAELSETLSVVSGNHGKQYSTE